MPELFRASCRLVQRGQGQHANYSQFTGEYAPTRPPPLSSHWPLLRLNRMGHPNLRMHRAPPLTRRYHVLCAQSPAFAIEMFRCFHQIVSIPNAYLHSAFTLQDDDSTGNVWIGDSDAMCHMYHISPPLPCREEITIDDKRRLTVESVSNTHAVFQYTRTRE